MARNAIDLSEYRRKRAFDRTPEPRGEDGGEGDRVPAKASTRKTSTRKTSARKASAKKKSASKTSPGTTSADKTPDREGSTGKASAAGAADRKASAAGTADRKASAAETSDRKKPASSASEAQTPTDAPAGQAGGAAAGNRFVVQEHHARRLHWDLRLEHEGVLASWALPRGFPDDPGENRLAVHTEDHPLEYLTFAGDIPEGSYGAGTMTIWDEGTYEAEKFTDEKVTVRFDGRRLRGRYALFRTGRRDDDRGRDWLIHRMDPPEPGQDPMPHELSPMLATLSELPPDDEVWAYEIKWDGVRALAFCEPGHLRLVGRSGRDITSQYPEIGPMVRALGSRHAVLDGELVAVDEQGRPSFERLQRRMHVTSATEVRRRAREIPVTFVLFDLLYLDGRSLLGRPYRERREALAALGLAGRNWQTPTYQHGDGEVLLEAARERGLEGIVAKRLDSAYRPGRRSRDWLKVKATRTQEVVIGGWVPGAGRRSGEIGALLAGYYEPADRGKPALRFAGKVGTGFDDAELRRLRELLAPLERRSSPFTGRQPQREARFVEPTLVCEVQFAEWTRSGTLRQPSYRGLRDDKPATEVIREEPVAPPSAEASPEAPAETASETPGEAAAGGGEAAAPQDLRAGATPGADTGADSGAGGRSPNGQSPPGRAARRKGPGTGTRSRRQRGVGELTEGRFVVEGRELKLSNLDKVLYPQTGTTKGQVLAYYRDLAPALLPHLRGRPLTMKRYPDGVDGPHFYEKQAPSWRPDWVQTVAVPSEHSSRRTVDYCLVEDLPTLLWAVNLADLEMHALLSRVDDLDRPTELMFDLDPGEGVGLRECARVAQWVRELFEDLGMQAFVKASGSKGLHLHVPLHTAVSFDETKEFAHAVAALTERQHPKEVVSRMTRARRTGKVLIDWSQNSAHKTTVVPFSLRARSRPWVAAPLEWGEVAAIAAGRARPESALLEAEAVLAQLERRRKLFGPVLRLRQELPDLAG